MVGRRSVVKHAATEPEELAPASADGSTGSAPDAADGRETGSPTDLFSRLGRHAVDHPRAVLAVWGLLLVGLGVLGLGLPDRLGTGGFDVPGSDSLQVQQLLETEFPGQSADPTVVVLQADTLSDAAGLPVAVAGVRDRVAVVEGVAGIRSYLDQGGAALLSADGRTTYLSISLAGDQNEQVRIAADVEAAATDGAPPGITISTGGKAALYSHVNEISRSDLETAELLSFPITLIVLLLVFGSGVAAGLPVLLAMVSLVITLGLLYLLTMVTTLSIYVTSTASIIGIGVGIDYALFIVTRYREELSAGVPGREAVIKSVSTSGRSVAVSGLTVVVALAGMFLVDIQGFRSMAIGSMTVVTLAVVASLTLLPAVLGMLGPRIERFAIRRGVPARHRTSGWHLWALRVMRRPVRFLLAALATLLVLAAPLAGISLGQPSASTLPAGTGPRVALEQLSAAFGPGAVGPVEVVVPTPGGADDPVNVARLQDLEAALAADPGVLAVNGAAAVAGAPTSGLVSQDGSLARIIVVGTDNPQSTAGQALVGRIRDVIIPSTGVDALVGGQGASDLDLTDKISERLPWVVGGVLTLSFLLLVVALRSIILPLKAIVMNLLSVAAAYGVVVALFQWGWGGDILQFQSEGFIQAFVPLFLFSVLFGLSMDYEVFLMTRMREEWDRTGSNELAVARGLERTGRTVTSAALIMVVVFAAFTASRLLAFKAMGFGLAAAVLIDATVVRVVAVPAAMRLLGDLNWWLPAWLDRRLPHLESATPTAQGPRPVTRRHSAQQHQRIGPPAFAESTP